MSDPTLTTDTATALSETLTAAQAAIPVVVDLAHDAAEAADGNLVGAAASLASQGPALVATTLAVAPGAKQAALDASKVVSDVKSGGAAALTDAHAIATKVATGGILAFLEYEMGAMESGTKTKLSAVFHGFIASAMAVVSKV